MKEFLELFICFFEICIPYWCIKKIVGKRRLTHIQNILWYICVSIWIGLLYYQHWFYFYSRLYLLFEIIGTIFLVKWRYQISWKATFITISIFYESLYFFYLMGLVVEGYYLGLDVMVRTQTGITWHGIMISVVGLSITLVGFVMVYRLQKRIISIDGIEDKILLAVPVVQHLTLYVCDNAFYSTERMTTLKSIFGGTLACICLISFLIIYIMWKKGDYEIHLLEKRADVAEQKYQERIEGDRTRDFFLHDIQNHLLVINSILENEEVDRAKSYIKKMQDDYYNIGQGFYTGNVVIDAILGSKVQQAEKSGILIKVISDDLSDSFVSDRDLCSVLSNLLDNAIESCESMKENRNIRVQLENCSFGMVWNIENSCLNQEDTNKIKEKTNRKMGVPHGTGLQSVRYAIKKYDGIIVQKKENHIFKTTVVFYK